MSEEHLVGERTVAREALRQMRPAPMDEMAREPAIVNGPAAAAILAGGIGSMMIGLMAVLASANAAFSSALNFYRPAGALSGKTTVTIVVWLIAWYVLHRAWKDKEVEFGRIWAITLVLVGLGLLGTFPPFFDLF